MPAGNPNIREVSRATQFTADNQPDPEAKRRGLMKRMTGRKLIQAILEQEFIGEQPDFRKRVADYFKLDVEDVTNEMMLLFCQIIKAAEKADTQAFEAIMSRAYGKPKEDITITSKDKPVAITFEPINPAEFNIQTTEDEDGATGESIG